MVTDDKKARLIIERLKSDILSIEVDNELLLIALKESEASIMRRLKFEGVDTREEK